MQILSDGVRDAFLTLAAISLLKGALKRTVTAGVARDAGRTTG